MKVLVTGDREWDDVERVVAELEQLGPGTIIVHGACRGADNVSAAVAQALGYEVRAYPADWSQHHRAAGPIRNQAMINKENLPGEPIDLCLAFHNDIEHSRGTADMLQRARKASIPCRLCTSRDGKK